MASSLARVADAKWRECAGSPVADPGSPAESLHTLSYPPPPNAETLADCGLLEDPALLANLIHGDLGFCKFTSIHKVIHKTVDKTWVNVYKG